MFDNEDKAILNAEIERLSVLALEFGLDVDDDQIAEELLGEWEKQIDSVHRRDSGNDPSRAAVEKVAGKHQAQIRLDAIRELYKREPNTSELLRAGYQQGKPIEQPAQPPGPDSSPLALLTYYYRHLSPK